MATHDTSTNAMLVQKEQEPDQEPFCELLLFAYVKPPGRDWRLLEKDEQVFSSHRLEIQAHCRCRAWIDITPDNFSPPIPNIEWEEMSFAPNNQTCTRIKSGFYKARPSSTPLITTPTYITFRAEANCDKCPDCEGPASDEITVLFYDLI